MVRSGFGRQECQDRRLAREFAARLLRVHSAGNLHRGRVHCRLSRAKLDSYGRNLIGAFVPVRESDFGCCGPLFGGELALQKAQLDPAGEPVS